MASLRHGVVVGIGVVVVVLAASTAAFADVDGQATGGGTHLSMYDQREMRQIKELTTAEAKAKAAPKWEYASVANCPGNTPMSATRSDFCVGAVAACRGNTPQQGLGPSAKLFRRAIDPKGNPAGPWEQYGLTCFPQDAPGAPRRPVLTMTQILAAFHDTNFAKPAVNIQPKGNVTLVHLPTYFELQWPTDGFQPGEVDHPSPASLLGHRVEIEPVLSSVEYVYGDGSTSGPTTSLGGPYPSGDIRKTYEKAGAFPVRADVTYGGKFRVDGGQWIDIPGTVTIEGDTERLQVKTAHARLVTN